MITYIIFILSYVVKIIFCISKLAKFHLIFISIFEPLNSYNSKTLKDMRVLFCLKPTDTQSDRHTDKHTHLFIYIDILKIEIYKYPVHIKHSSLNRYLYLKVPDWKHSAGKPVTHTQMKEQYSIPMWLFCIVGCLKIWYRYINTTK